QGLSKARASRKKKAARKREPARGMIRPNRTPHLRRQASVKNPPTMSPRIPMESARVLIVSARERSTPFTSIRYLDRDTARKAHPRLVKNWAPEFIQRLPWVRASRQGKT